MAKIELRGTQKVFGGFNFLYKHQSKSTGTEMQFTVFVPPQAKTRKVPVLYYLSGLTCTDANCRDKGGAQQHCAKHGILLVFPDTSPRGKDASGAEVPNDKNYDLGQGAGFYLNATNAPWNKHFHMYDYITKELPALVNANFNVDSSRVSLFGHSMGGHGALTLALKNPGTYRSVSAFAPICNPINCPWGEKGFKNYLGSVEAGKAYDATELVASYSGPPIHFLIDQGTGDNFLKQKQLLPENFAAAAAKNAKVSVDVRMQDGYDHGYTFIATFMGDHIAYHAKALNATGSGGTYASYLVNGATV